MKIAICDDDSQELARISSFIDTYRRESKSTLAYKTFQSATELISNVSSGYYSILLLDILMPGINGMQAAHEMRAFDEGVKIVFLTSSPEFVVEAGLPQLLSISETELCALLSNGLENAIEAAAQADDEQFKKVRISCQTHKDNLLIFIENSFTGKVAMEGGLPQSFREGHGFGVKSMAMIAEKYNGYCSFEAKDEIFTLRIVLPLSI